jgi:GT2 family glycosyltransferase/SAM-dependent methyltransferase
MAPPDAPSRPGPAGHPTVSLIVVAYQAATHLPHLLDSVAALDYPRDRLDTIVVDNGSTDGTSELLADRYGWVRVLPQGRNLGFAEANDAGVRASDAECVAFVNADMRLDHDWLRELIAWYEPDERWTAVSSLILDWEGRLVDFAGATLNFHGHGNQVGHGVPIQQVRLEDGRELPFACGGAMLVGRDAFVDAGGFDPSYFIYFEDVDLGWRLRLLGHRIRLAAGARAFHRGHGTTSSFREASVRVLYERNALRTLIKNLDDEHLGRLLAPALLLLLERARLAAGVDAGTMTLGATRDAALTVDPLALAPLQAVGDVVAGLDDLLAERRRIQARRVVGDAELLALFGRPFQPAARDDLPYLESLSRVVRAFGLEELVPPPRPRVVVAAGGSRADSLDELAAALAGTADVRRAVHDDLEEAAEQADVLVLDPFGLASNKRLAAATAVRALDVRATPPAARGGELMRADVLLCGSQLERSAWVASLEREGRLGRPGLAAAMVVVADADGLRSLVAEPWRWERLRARRAAPPPPETGSAAGLAERATYAARRTARRAVDRARGLRLPGARTRHATAELETFRCNVCGAHNPVTDATFAREEPSCETCGSTSRWRSVVHVLATELFGHSVTLPEFPDDPSLSGVGLTDWEGYAATLAAKLDYTNTFLHKEPRLDLCELDPRWVGRFDFVLCSEVLEHVPPPVEQALANLRALLKPDGIAVVTTPYGMDGQTTEHFPELHRWEIVQRDGGRVLLNTTRDGDVQEHTDLTFHGGAGTTVEMRVFSEPALLAGLAAAGFAETVVYRERERRFGVGWPEPWSRPIAARASSGGSGRRRRLAG